MTHHKALAFHLTDDLRLSDGVTHAACRVRIAVVVDMGTIHKVGFALEPDGQIAPSRLGEPELTLPTGRLDNAFILSACRDEQRDEEDENEENERVWRRWAISHRAIP